MIDQVETIVILGGGLTKGGLGRFKTANFGEGGDRSGITGDRLRVEAAYCLYQENNQRMVIASGGQSFLKFKHPDISSVIKNELVQLGVPKERIIEENLSDNTYQQLTHLKDMLKTAGPIILTNRWHLPRVKAMAENIEELKDFYRNLKPKYLTAEEVLLKHNPSKWREIIKSAYASKAMQDRLKLEKQGIEQIKKGTYRYE